MIMERVGSWSISVFSSILKVQKESMMLFGHIDTMAEVRSILFELLPSEIHCAVSKVVPYHEKGRKLL